MSSRWTQLLLGLSLLVNAFVLAGFVYRSWIEPPSAVRHGFVPPPPPSGPGGQWNPANRPSALDALTQDLGLDDGQRQAIRPLIDQYNARRAESYREYQRLREQLVAELQKPEFDMARLEAVSDQASTLRASQLKDTLRSIADLSGKLRPDQRERLHKSVAERYSGSAWSARPPGGGSWQGPPGSPPRPPGPGAGPGPGPGPSAGQGRPPQ